MNRRTLTLTFALLTLVFPARGWSEPPAEEKGPFLGVLFCPLPEALVDHLPQLPRDSGVLVTHVLPGSPAAKAGLRRHDILLRYRGTKIRDGDHLARLIRASKDGQRVELLLVRGGKEVRVPVKLGLGPMLKIARDLRGGSPGIAKPGGPAAVSVTAVPMDHNRMRVTFEYSDAGKFRKLTCSGSVREIDSQVGKLPRKLQGLARVAVRRLRDLEVQKSPSYSPPKRR